MKMCTQNILRHLLILLLVGICSVPMARAAEKVELRVEAGSRSGVIEVGQKFYIKIILSNIQETPSAPTAVPGAKIQYFGHQSSSSSFSSVNGKTSQSIVNIYALTLKAEKTGSFSFGPVTVGGVRSNTVSYTIAEAGTTPQAGPGMPNNGGNTGNAGAAAQQQAGQQGPTFIGKGNDQLFLRANVSKTTAYEQEALVYTVKLYTTYGTIKFIGATDAPKFDGFVIEESPAVSNQLSYETYQGRTYATAVIARYIIFPQMPGQLKILGNKYTVSTDAEEYYHDPFFSQLTVRKPIQLNVTPNDLTVTVKPLPSPKPANFSGGVGHFVLSSNLASSDAVANQAASISYLVTGEGNLKYVHLPDLNAIYPDEIEVFTPTTDVKTTVGSTNVSGSVNFDYSFMPMEAGTFAIPPVQMVYFNPATGNYETTTSKGYTLKVARGAESEKSQATQVYDSRLMPVVIPSGKAARPFVKGIWYWFLFIIPTAALVGAAIGHRKYMTLHADVMGLRSRRAGKLAKKRLKRAMECMKANNEGGFFDEMLKALWGYLSDKLKLPTSELNRENVSQILEERGVGQDSVTSLLALLDECEFAKYSPASARKSMDAVYQEGSDVLDTLQDAFAKAAKVAKDKNIPTALLIIGLCMAGVTEVQATPPAAQESPMQLVEEADTAYARDDYDKTIELYREVIDQNGASASLLYNLGNAYYKSGNEGEARLCLERAKRLDPSNRNIDENIAYIAGRVEDANRAELKGKKGDVAPDELGFFGRANRKISVDTSSDAWAEMAATAFILLILALALYLFSSNVRFKKIGFFSALIFLFFSGIFIAFAEMAASHFDSRDEAVLMQFKQTLSAEPDADAPTIGFPLHRGTKLRILDTEIGVDGKPAWYKVELNSSNIGWLKAGDLEII